MGWKKQENAAQYKGASWENLVKKVPNCSVAEAMRVAVKDPEITYFFFVRDSMFLEGKAGGDGWTEKGQFNPGDAVFFKGESWYGSAPQCDAYEKTPLAVAYISPKDNKQFKDIGCYVSADGTPAIDIACLFASNYATNELPMLRANNNNPPTNNPFNDNIRDVLSNHLVEELQSKGITVLLTIMNAHSATGWDEFTDQSSAQDFVNYLKNDVVDQYGLDGIDIDDEYSRHQDNNGHYVDPSSARGKSLPMVTTLMKQSMPDKLITKALWSDTCIFEANWNGHTLGNNLDYGWQMAYYQGDADDRLSIYTNYDMTKRQLCLGFSAENQFEDRWNQLPQQVKSTVQEGYAGCMMFSFENQPNSVNLMKEMVDGMRGENNWNKNTDC